MTNEVESIRAALRGRRLSVLATELGVPLPTIETFVHGRAGFAPALLDGLSKLLALPDKTIPAPVPRMKTMKLSARSLKITAVLDPGGLVDPGSGARVAQYPSADKPTAATSRRRASENAGRRSPSTARTTSFVLSKASSKAARSPRRAWSCNRNHRARRRKQLKPAEHEHERNDQRQDGHTPTRA